MQTVTSKLGAFLRALALLGLVAVALPWLLVAAAEARFGGPAPWSAVPPPADWSGDTIWSAISDRMSEATLADVVIRVGLAIAWIAVIVVLVTVVAEVVHMIRHRGLALPPVRGLGPTQTVARMIAAGLLVVVPMFAAPSRATAHDAALLLPSGRAPAEHRELDGHTPPVGVDHASAAAPDAPGEGAPATYVVTAGDSVYGIAERLAGSDPGAVVAYADRLLELNLGKQMNDGRWFTNAAYVDVGWVLELPSDATPTAAAASPSSEIVDAGESLWSIATDRLGDGERWPEIYELNEGREFDDGRTLHDPDVIHPGWVLDLPTATESAPDPAAPPVVPGVAEEAAAQTDDVTDGAQDLVAASAPVVAEPEPGLDLAPTARPENVWLDPDPLAVGAPDVVAAPAVTAGRVDGAPGGSGLDEDAGAVEGVEGVEGVELLTFERAAMLSAGVIALLAVRRRATMRRAPPNSVLPEPAPVAVVTERALRSIDPGERFARVDIAIRHAAATLVDHGSRVEAVAVADDGDLELWVSQPAPLGAVWESVAGSETRWRLPPATPIELLVDDARRVGAPCPTLVQLGRDVDGRDVYVDLEALEAIEVGGRGDQADAVVTAIAATLAASVFAEVTTLIGLGVPDEAFLGHRHHRPARDPQRAFEEAADAIGSTAAAERSTFELRARVTSGEAWEPAVVLAGSAVGRITPPRRRTGLAVVSASPIHGPSSRLAPDGDAWTLLPLGVRLIPIGLSPADAAAVASLTAVPDPAPAPLLVDERTPGPDDTIVVLDGIDDGGPTADHATDVETLPHAVIVRLFGPVTVAARDGAIVDFERSKTKELIAWLATHRSRATRSNARAALWELDVRDATFANVVSEARRALARAVEPPDGEEWVGRTMTDALPLHPLVVTDLDLIEHAVTAARLQPPDLAIATLRPAVDLVVGVPFEGTGYLWPDAEGITSDLVLRAITVTNALAAHCLSVGDIEGVFAATSRGLQVLPAHEEMVAARMRAYALVGDRAGVRSEWETYERAIVSDPWSDGEPSDRMVELRRELLSG